MVERAATAALLFAALAAGCESLTYYTQVTSGHLALMRARQPVDRVLSEPTVVPELKARLRYVESVLAFAMSELKLPAEGRYRSYAKIDRPYVVWNVFATPEFSLEPVQWCYPVIGCAVYRGYFDVERARHKAGDLAASGLDADVAGAVAYSSLGWFGDPLLSTFIEWDDGALASLLFHELAHARLFVRDDTKFNESFATFVERAGIRNWLRDQPALCRYERDLQAGERFRAFVFEWRERLEQLYRSDISPFAMRYLKAELFSAMRESFVEQRSELGGDRYQAFFREPMNNARFAPMTAYFEWVPAFAELYDSVGGDWLRFYEAAERVGELTSAERARELDFLAEQHVAAASREDHTTALHCRAT